MNEKHLSFASCSFPYVTALSVVFLILRLLVLGFSSFLGDLVLVGSFFTLSYGADSFRIGERRKGSLLMLASMMLYLVGTFVLTSHNKDPKFRETVLASLALSFPSLLTLPLCWKMGGKKNVVLLCSSILGSALIYFCVRPFVYSYTYLYMEIGNIVLHTKVFLYLVYGVMLAVLLELGYRGAQNYLNYTLFILGFFASGMESGLRNDLDFSLKNCGLALLSSWLPLAFLLFLIVYVKGEKPEERVYERRNIVFSNMVYQELKPIKKRKKAPKFEVPPNVPKMKNAGQDE